MRELIVNIPRFSLIKPSEAITPPKSYVRLPCKQTLLPQVATWIKANFLNAETFEGEFSFISLHDSKPNAIWLKDNQV